MDIIALYTKQEKSIPEISRIIGLPQSNVRYALKKEGVLRSRSDAVRLAGRKGLLGSGFRGKKRIFTDAHKKQISIGKAAHGSIHAKGTSLKPSGYVEITRGENKGRGLHVVIMEEIIGRKLFAFECVHHKDKDRSNNNPDNLQLMTRSKHASHHAKENIINRSRTDKGRLK